MCVRACVHMRLPCDSPWTGSFISVDGNLMMEKARWWDEGVA